jgi:hypothetical protein
MPRKGQSEEKIVYALRQVESSSATNRTVHRARPFGGSLQTIAMIRCRWCPPAKRLLRALPFRRAHVGGPFLVAMADLPNSLGVRE